MSDDFTRRDWDMLRWMAHNEALSITAADARPLVAAGYITVEQAAYTTMLWGRITPDGFEAHIRYMCEIGRMCKCRRTIDLF